MRFDERLIELRKAKGYNQEQLAEKVGVSRQAVSKWETGDAQPDFAKLIALADALETDLDTLCGRATAVPTDPPVRAPAEKPKQKPMLVILAVALALAFFAAGLLFGARLLPQKRQTASTGALSVVGVKFSSLGGGRVSFQFVPSVYEDCAFTLLLQGADGGEEEYAVTCKNGRCAGVLTLAPEKTYAATVCVRKRDASYLLPIANSLRLEKNEVIWD